MRWHDTRDVRLEDVPEPAPRPGWAVVEVELCGICGSDVAEYVGGPKMIRRTEHPLSGQAAPVTLGHELAGRVVCPSDLPGALAVGTRVTVDACLRCGTCPACVAGDYHRCLLGGSIGLHVDGGFASLVSVPEYSLVPVPDAVTDMQAALSEPFAVALHGLDRAGLQAAERVCVLGFGPIGAASALVARALGAVVLVVERSAERLQVARDLGFATTVVEDKLHRAVRGAWNGELAGVVVESTGVAAMLGPAIDTAQRGGRIVVLGIPGSSSEIDATRLVLFERTLVGSLGYRGDLSRILAMVASGAFDPSSIVGATIPLARTVDQLEAIASGPLPTIKTLVSTRV